MRLYQYIKPIIFFEAAQSAVSPQGRLVEVPYLASMDGLDFITLQLVIEAIRNEANDTQVLFDLSQGWPSFVDIRIGRLNLDMTSITATRRHVTFSSAQNPELIISFSHDCAFQETFAVKIVPHPALGEFWFGSRAHKAGAANNFYHVSPPIPFPANSLFPGLGSEQIERCRAANGAVRFVVYRKPRGESLRTLLVSSPSGKVDPVFALKIGKALTRTIKSLHTTRIAPEFANVGIAHGNVRLEDVFVAIDEAGEPHVQLTGFLSSRVSWIEKISGKSVRSWLPPCTQAYLQSPWELMDGIDHQYTARDDLYRVGQLISILVHGLGYEQELKRLYSTKTLAQFKLQAPVISSPFSTDYQSGTLSTEGITVWVTSLSVINARVFGMDSNSYEDIIGALDVMILQAAKDFAALEFTDFMTSGSVSTVVEHEGTSMGEETLADSSFEALKALADLASGQQNVQRKLGQGGAFKPMQSRRTIHKPSLSPSNK